MRSVTARGLSWRVVGGHDDYWQQIEIGNWERRTLNCIDRFVGPGSFFLDIGAWIGPTTLYAAARGANVVSVEADPLALIELRENISANPELAERIEVVPKAIHPKAGEISFGSRRDGNDSMSSFALDGLKTKWTVPTITPDELASMVPPGVPLFIKMDIEAGEYDVVPAAAALWRLPGVTVHLSTHSRLVHCSFAEMRDRTERMLEQFSRHSSFSGGAFPLPRAFLARSGLAMFVTEWLFVPRKSR